jgi:CRP/FNR family cyclic AMP-dependent transcriptional regulator
MRTVLQLCAGLPQRSYPPGTVLLPEGETTGRLYVLIDGEVEVIRGGTRIALDREPGAIFGEMSLLLGVPHTATVSVFSPLTAHEIENGDSFLRSYPAFAYHIARLLARRVNAATTYLVDLKRQFEGQSSHLGMVGEVLESLIHQQDQEFTPGSDRQPDPRM